MYPADDEGLAAPVPLSAVREIFPTRGFEPARPHYWGANSKKCAKPQRTAEELSALSPGLTVRYDATEGVYFAGFGEVRSGSTTAMRAARRAAGRRNRASSQRDRHGGVRPQSANGEDYGWAVVIRYPDERRDTIAQRTKCYRTACGFAEAARADLIQEHGGRSRGGAAVGPGRHGATPVAGLLVGPDLGRAESRNWRTSCITSAARSRNLATRCKRFRPRLAAAEVRSPKHSGRGCTRPASAAGSLLSLGLSARFHAPPLGIESKILRLALACAFASTQDCDNE